MVTAGNRKLRISPAHRRIGWITADQAISSLTNLVLSILVARQVSVEDFGIFALVYATYLFALELVRALVLESLVISFSGDYEGARRAAPSVLGAALSAAIVMSLACLAVAFVGPSQMRGASALLAAALPGLILQDACRSILLAYRRPRAAFVNDLTWGFVLVVGIPILGGLSQPSVAAFLLLWGATGTLSAVLGLFQVASVPAIARAREWMRQTRPRGPYFLLDFLVDSAALQVSIILVGTFAGLAAVGAFNAARVAVGPIGVLILAVSMVITSEGRRLAEDPARLRFFVGGVGVAMLLTGAAWGLIVRFLPVSIGEAMLGASFVAAQAVLIPMSLHIGLRGFMSSSRIAMRVIKPGPGAVILQLCLAVLTLVAVTAGAIIGAASGAAWGLVAVGVVAAAAWWRTFAGANDEQATPFSTEGRASVA